MENKLTLHDAATMAALDRTTYCAFELAEEWTKDIPQQLEDCASRHEHLFDSDQFCVAMLYAEDPMCMQLRRRKFYAWPFLPKPRMSQTVWLYDIPTQKFTRLWSLPSPDTAMSLTMMNNVAPEYENMRTWSQWIFKPGFYQKIREQHGITMLSEEEHLERISIEGTQPGLEDMSPSPTNPFDVLGFDPKQMRNTAKALTSQDSA